MRYLSEAHLPIPISPPFRLVSETPQLERSLVVGNKSDEVDPIRTSYSASIG